MKSKAVEATIEWEDSGLATTMFCQLPLPSWIIDLESLQFLQVNQSAISRYGYSEETFLAADLLLLRPNDPLDVLASDYAKFASEPLSWFERRHRTAHGQWIETSVRIQPIRYHGKVAGLVMVQDKTIEHEFLAAQDRAHQKFDSILGAAMDAVVIIDREGLIAGWSGESERMFGWSRTEAMGVPMHDLIMPERFRQRHLEGLALYVVSGVSRILGTTLNLFALRRSGEEFPIQIRITRLAGIEVEFVAYIREAPGEPVEPE